MADPPVVTVTATIMDGAVVRWYASEAAVEYGREMISASRNGVMVPRYLNDIPDEMLTAALDAWKALKRGSDVGHLATHKLAFASRELKPAANVVVPGCTDENCGGECGG